MVNDWDVCFPREHKMAAFNGPPTAEEPSGLILGALTYSLELAGIWAFAFFWLVKSLELRRSQGFERQVMREARGAIVAS